MKPTLSIIIVAFILVGCAHQAAHYNVPDASKLAAASQKLVQKVTEARATNARASAAVSAAKASSDREGQQLAEQIVPKVNELLRISPVDLRPEVQALQNEVTGLQAAHQETADHIAAGQREQSTLTAQLEEANAAKNELARYSPEYLAAVDKLAERANAAEAGWSKDSKSLAWYRLHWWTAWIVAGLGVVVCVVLAFLKATGRLALSIPRI
jgi:hypothetical protein